MAVATCTPGRPATYDYAYVRCGSCTIGMFVEPLGPWRMAHATARRTAVDWAHPVKALVAPRATARPRA